MNSHRSFRSRFSRLAGVSALALASLGLLTSPLNAENAAVAPRVSSAPKNAIYVPPVGLEQFRPAQKREDHTIDYGYLDEALRWMVVPMGPSLRQTAPRRDPRLGTRRIQGHESRFRLEGNRVGFSFFNDEIRSSLTEYREDLERVGSTLDITRIPRNEQLAFWFNLHNVAVVEALAYEYPLTQPALRTFGSNEASLDDAKLVTIGGVELSPRDIRERIVFPNWQDPKVMYGFWRGEIGGPSLQRIAFNGDNVDSLLDASAKEFVNSLRGVQKYNGALQVSELYREAAPFYFEKDADLRAHLGQHAGEAVQKLIGKTDKVSYSADYELDLADMSRGETFSVLDNYGFLSNSGGISVVEPVRTRPNLGARTLFLERNQKLQRAVRRGVPLGTVIVAGEDGVASKEVQ